MNKKYIVGIIIALIVVILIVLSGGNKTKDNKKDNKKEESNIASIEEQTIEGIRMSGLNMLYEEGSTTIVVSVKNTTNKEMYVKRIDTVLYDEEGKKIGDTFFFVDKKLAPGEENVYQTGFASDVTNSASVKYSIVK